MPINTSNETNNNIKENDMTNNVIKPIFWRPNPECFYELELYEGLKLGYLEIENNKGGYIDFKRTQAGVDDLKNKYFIGDFQEITNAVINNPGKWQGLLSKYSCPCNKCQQELIEMDESVKASIEYDKKRASKLLGKKVEDISDEEFEAAYMKLEELDMEEEDLKVCKRLGKELDDISEDEWNDTADQIREEERVEFEIKISNLTGKEINDLTNKEYMEAADIILEQEGEI